MSEQNPLERVSEEQVESSKKFLELMKTLRKEGKLKGKNGQYVMYSNECELIRIVTQEEMMKGGRGGDFGGYMKIDIEE